MIHPIWWSDKHANAPDRLEEFFQSFTSEWEPEQIRRFDNALGEHIGVKRRGTTKNENSNRHLPVAGKFNTDADALTKRIKTHEKFGSNDLNKWIFQNLDIEKGNSVLDLGCGTGKQAIPIAQLVDNTGQVFAFDFSQKALDILSQEAKRLKVDSRIVARCGDLDNLNKHLDNHNFDRVLGSYSLYYSKEPQTVFETIYQHLKPGGILFFCGPSKENNAELKMFHYNLLKDEKPPESNSAKFMEETGPMIVKNLFSKIEYYSFQNPLRFDSANSLYDYWSAYNLYNEKIDTQFKDAASRYFQTNSKFETIKRVVGIKAIK